MYQWKPYRVHEQNFVHSTINNMWSKNHTTARQNSTYKSKSLRCAWDSTHQSILVQLIPGWISDNIYHKCVFPEFATSFSISTAQFMHCNYPTVVIDVIFLHRWHDKVCMQILLLPNPPVFLVSTCDPWAIYFNSTECFVSCNQSNWGVLAIFSERKIRRFFVQLLFVKMLYLLPGPKPKPLVVAIFGIWIF